MSRGRRVIGKFRVPIFTITNRGMFTYGPETREATKVATGLTWLGRSRESRDSNVAAKP